MDILSIYKTLKETPSDYLTYAVLIFISVWLFREIRSTYLKNISDELVRSEKNLSIYSKAYRSICKYERKEIDLDELSIQLESLPSICSKKVFIIYLDWEKDKNSTVISEMKQCIENEMNFHKSQQSSELTSWVRSDSFLDAFPNFIKKSPSKSFFWPAVYTFIILLASVFFVATTIYVSMQSTINQILFSFYIFGGVLLVVSTMSILEFILFKKIIKKLPVFILTIFFAGLNATILSFTPHFGG